MAILGKKFPGIPSGSIDDLVFRNRRGQTEVYTKSLNFTLSNSPAAKKQRSSFAFQRKTAAAVDKVYLLKELWKNSTIPGYTSYEKQMKVNSALLSGPEDISGICLLPPCKTFSADLKSFHLDGNIFKVTVHPLNLSYPQELAVSDISAHGILLLTDPPDDEDTFKFIPLASGGMVYKNDIELHFCFSILNPDDWYFNNYKKRQFVICLIMCGLSGTPEYFSVNLSGRIDEPVS